MENNEIGKVIKELQESGVFSLRAERKIALGINANEAMEYVKKIMLESDGTIKNFVPISELVIFCSWIQFQYKPGLALSGSSGRGKTLLGMFVLPTIYYALKRLIIRPVSSYEIISKWDKLTKHPVIIVDDVGEEPPINDFGSKYESFSRLVDFCEKYSKVLILTTNLSSAEMISRYGLRTVDRLDKLCYTIKFEGESLRK